MSFPDQIKIKQLNKADPAQAHQLFSLLQQVFEVEQPIQISDNYLDKLLGNSFFVAFAAIHQNEVVGGLTGYKLPMYDREAEEFYIYDIAVIAESQRMGIGKQLISAAREYCLQNNISLMFVQADQEDTHALDFYRSANAKEQKVSQFIYPLS